MTPLASVSRCARAVIAAARALDALSDVRRLTDRPVSSAQTVGSCRTSCALAKSRLPSAAAAASAQRLTGDYGGVLLLRLGLLSAAAALARRGPANELIVALTADEEHASTGMAGLVDAGVRADAAVVCEPTGLAVMPAHKGFVWVEAGFSGRAAHGSRPDQGVDAIQHAAEFLVAMAEYEECLFDRAPHPLLGWGSIHAGTISGGAAPSVYPERCEVVVERRTLPREPPEAVM